MYNFPLLGKVEQKPKVWGRRGTTSSLLNKIFLYYIMSYIDANFTITKTTSIKYLKIEISQLILFESCSFNVYLYDEDKNIIEMKFLKIEGDEYKLWKNEDDYIINLIKEKVYV